MTYKRNLPVITEYGMISFSPFERSFLAYSFPCHHCGNIQKRKDTFMVGDLTILTISHNVPYMIFVPVVEKTWVQEPFSVICIYI